MRAVAYSRTGDPEVLRLEKREVSLPQPNEVLVQIHVAGVNPTDCRTRRGSKPGESLPFPEVVPGQDGAGVITAVGADVPASRVGERVWIFEAGWQRANGATEEYIAIDARQAVPLPDAADFDLGASLGIPYLTAHRCLTIGSDGTNRLAPGALGGRTVLVAGGAGAVGHAAIQLAKWAGAKVITTVSSAEKASLAGAAGADVVVNYLYGSTAERIREATSQGVDLIVEVNPAANAVLDTDVLAEGGSISIYASSNEPPVLEIRPMMQLNAGIHFIYVYTIPRAQKENAVEDVEAALFDGALATGADVGLPVIHFSLRDAPTAHQAVEQHVVGKVLIDVIEARTNNNNAE